jgi:hypothetical protein
LQAISRLLLLIQKKLVWTKEEIQKQINKSETNLFSNKGSFNLKHNSNCKTKSIYSLLDYKSDITSLSSNNSDREYKNPDIFKILISEIPLYKVTNLIKIYQDEGKKFRGELYNILEAKLQIFQECYNKVRI